MKQLTPWLQRVNITVFSLYATTAAFSAYTCMYAFRKPFTVATYDGLTWAGVDYKILLITTQVIGYMLSKFIGIKVVSELPPPRRAGGILLLMAGAGGGTTGFCARSPSLQYHISVAERFAFGHDMGTRVWLLGRKTYHRATGSGPIG